MWLRVAFAHAGHMGGLSDAHKTSVVFPEVWLSVDVSTRAREVWRQDGVDRGRGVPTSWRLRRLCHRGMNVWPVIDAESEGEAYFTKLR